jgi:hypothetical protein
MKLIKTLALGVVALALTSAAQAVTVKVTGSTAYRKALYAAAINYLGGAANVRAAYIGTSLSSASQVTFINPTSGDVIQACMAGSVGGVDWVVHGTNAKTSPTANDTQAWINPSFATAATTTAVTLAAGPGYGIGGGVAYATTTVGLYGAASPADFCTSDSLQDSTAHTAASTGVTLTPATTDTGSIGVVQFLFAKGTQHPAVSAAAYGRFTNMTALGYQALAASGVAPLSFFTGVSTDSAYNVALVGRDNDSGTRLGTNFETGYGNTDTPISQYRGFDVTGKDVGSASGALTVINSLTAVGGVVGYASGGHVKKMLDATYVDATHPLAGGKPCILVAYVGTGDKPAVSSQNLTYNGVVQTDSATQSGQYSFWTYAQLYYNPTLDVTKAAVATALADAIQTDYATAAVGFKIADMLSSRGTEGSVINP